ncbi:MAG: UDP-N-acetylglucosamine 2-epimerase (non-hydrolyzing) [Planctomycetes bacterium]|nr:UDP-N-acetylglucosamine 2-epimerase (non-hydrolyzing) [Planctomycetota bacterium]
MTEKGSRATPRVLAVIGTRPEAVKLAPVVHAFWQRPEVELRVLATAQHRAMLDQTLAFFGIRPDRDLNAMRPDQSLAELTAQLLLLLDPALKEEAPALVLAQGDTTTVMVVAMCCSYRDIPFAHVEAGLRSGDLRRPFPEEQNRMFAARVAALNFAPTKCAADNLLREGVRPESVQITGNTVIDALQWTLARVAVSKFQVPQGQRLVLVTAHRRENFGAPFDQLCIALRRLADRADVRILYPLHPNPNVRQAAKLALGDHAHIKLVEPLDYPDMVAAMQACDLILTDSGGVQEEAPSLGKPVLLLRDVTERPEGVLAGAVRLVGTDPERIVREAVRLLDDQASYAAMAVVRNPYGDGRAALRIVDRCCAFLRSRH